MNGLRWHPAILLILLAAAPLVNLPAAAQQSSAAPGVGDSLPNHEVLNYAIEWRLIPAGVAKLTWMSIARPSGSANELRLHLESAGLVSRLYRVNDDYTAVLGQNLCGQSTFLAAHEGNRNKETRVTYDGSGHKANYLEKDLNKNISTVRDVEIPSCVHDVIGGLMVLRTLNLEPGKTVQIPVSDGKKFVQVKIESQRREDVSTPMGVKKAIRYEAFVFDNVLFKRAGHLQIWLTDDSRRLPVQLQVRLQFAIGTITFKLEKEEKL